MKERHVAYWVSYVKQRGIVALVTLAIRRLLSLWVAWRLRHCGKLTLQSGSQISGFKMISIGGLTAGERLRLEALRYFGGIEYQPSIRIGQRVSMGTGVHIAGVSSIDIGNDVLIGSYVTIIDHDHGCYRGGMDGSQPSMPPALRPLHAAAISIGDCVHVGDHAVILKGVSVERGSVIGAGAVVTHNVPEGAVVAGNPARVIRVFDQERGAWVAY